MSCRSLVVAAFCVRACGRPRSFVDQPRVGGWPKPSWTMPNLIGMDLQGGAQRRDSVADPPARSCLLV